MKKKSSRKRGASHRSCAEPIGSAPSLTVKAWAIVNKETGRLMLREVSTFPGQRTEMLCMWLKRSEAEYYKSGDERIVRVAITEIAK